MNISDIFSEDDRNKPFVDYEEYTIYLFYLVDTFNCKKIILKYLVLLYF